MVSTNEERLILSEGASVSQMGAIFKKDNRTVAAAIKGLPSVGERMGFPIYDLGDAAGRLSTPDEARLIEILKKDGIS